MPLSPRARHRRARRRAASRSASSLQVGSRRPCARPRDDRQAEHQVSSAQAVAEPPGGVVDRHHRHQPSTGPSRVVGDDEGAALGGDVLRRPGPRRGTTLGDRPGGWPGTASATSRSEAVLVDLVKSPVSAAAEERWEPGQLGSHSSPNTSRAPCWRAASQSEAGSRRAARGRRSPRGRRGGRRPRRRRRPGGRRTTAAGRRTVPRRASAAGWAAAGRGTRIDHRRPGHARPRTAGCPCHDRGRPRVPIRMISRHPRTAPPGTGSTEEPAPGRAGRGRRASTRSVRPPVTGRGAVVGEGLGGRYAGSKPRSSRIRVVSPAAVGEQREQLARGRSPARSAGPSDAPIANDGSGTVGRRGGGPPGTGWRTPSPRR